ncbi:amidase [Novipirellula artificiosorum]|uniref:6-aminohexanoate-cyclic-dimer hydrolase n=1 Tax=Novipirellula artificiosorum TaxID=2528016 RepID=A0A5C6CWR0_9BACT|nr:amidase [Novipirellula artificiosorum]TWU28990.1 6-aminohexanoate-cyclic-dimer hydrolase [Novipirellula artificiosorum]
MVFSRSSRFDRRYALKSGGCFIASMLGSSVASADETRAPVFTDYDKYDGVGLSNLVRQGLVSPIELLESAISRAEAVNAKINAIVTPLYDLARKQARTDLPTGTFQGVPFLVKDLGYWMKGIECTEGSSLYRGNRPTEDDTVVKRLKAAGLVIMGRTHSCEFGGSASSESAIFGVTRNPWDLDRIAGGSSGGSAAAVAAGIVPMASGSDGGGSIRIPASCCGLFGMKVTRGRVPLGPRVYELLQGLATLGVITRSVRDSAAMLDTIGGPAKGDAYAHPPQKRNYLEELAIEPGQLRVGLVTRSPSGSPVDPSCVRAAEEAGRLCERLGHRVDDVTESFVNEFAPEKLIVMWTTSARLAVEHRLAQLGRKLKDEDLEYITRVNYEQAGNAKAIDLERERLILHEMSRRMARFQRNYDMLLMPTLGQLPLEPGRLSQSRNDFEGYIEDLLTFTPFCVIANQTGQPAMSVPLHWTAENLPVGVQFFGRFGDEATLFRLASQLEQAQPWKDRRPLLR